MTSTEPSNLLSQMAMAAPLRYLDMLNDAQRQAVLETEGPVLVLAGAGTGKTKLLTTRIAHLIYSRKARPGEILAVTFTNKAAHEMRQRVGQLVGDAANNVRWLGTFHSLANRMLRSHAEIVGLRPDYAILDADDQLRLIKQVARAFNIDEKRWPARMLAAIIDRWKNRGLYPDKVPSAEARNIAEGRGAEIYKAYQERLFTLNACDYGDLLLHTLRLLSNYPDVLATYAERFRYILVDEYQDTNVVQYLWLRLLARENNNLFCVGDDDQSIYGWRGAEVDNILRFEKEFTGTKLIRLECNYRSTPHILSAASGVIAKNKRRLGKTLYTDHPEGDKVCLIGVWDGDEEARWVSDEIEAAYIGAKDGTKIEYNEMAILVRAAYQMRAFEDRFLSIGLPYRVIGGPRFYERQEIRDAIAYMRMVARPDDGAAFERIINRPRRNIGEKTVQQINIAAREGKTSLLEAARRLSEMTNSPIKGRSASNLRSFISMIDRWRELYLKVEATIDEQKAPVGEKRHVRLCEKLLEESGYVDMWRQNRAADAPGRLENIKELMRSLGEFDTLQGFLDHVSLVMENERGDHEDAVSIMTLHAAKGLEFRLVFLPGWEEGVFPSQRSLDELGAKGLEEERRLAYVGMTRAKERLKISFAANRRIYNQWQSSIPSRFIDELPAENVIAANVGDQEERFVDQDSTIEYAAANHNTTSSPGWRRLKGRAGSGKQMVAGAKRGRATSSSARKFRVGQRVFHQKFGYGRIVGLQGDKAALVFETAGEKKIQCDFLQSSERAAEPET